jgi:hypothetical protein
VDVDNIIMLIRLSYDCIGFGFDCIVGLVFVLAVIRLG